MATSITSSQGQSIRGLHQIGQLEQASAKNVLQQLQTQIAGKSGVLKLMHTRKDQDMVFERKSWYQAIARRSGKMQDTATALKTLYQSAGMSPSALKQLEVYLSTHNNRVGGTALANLIQGHLNSQINDALVHRVLPREENHNLVMGSTIFGTRQDRREGCVSPYQETAAEHAQNVSDRDARNLQLQRDCPDLNPHYQIGDGLNGADQLVGISRSANAARGQAFDLSKPIVIFFGGSHGNVADYGYPAATAAGPQHMGGMNFLSVDYRGFGQSSDTQPTPKSVTQDAVKVYEHVKSLGFRPDQIILRGYSMGAVAAARVHAIADLKGEQLMGVVYDRPMASAADTAGVVGGKFGKAATKASVGGFGVDRYLQSIRQLGSGDMRRALVIADNEARLGPIAERMAQERGVLLTKLNEGHAAHWHANEAFTAFLGRILPDPANAPLAGNPPAPANPASVQAAAPQAPQAIADSAPVSPAQARMEAERAVTESVLGWLDAGMETPFEDDLAVLKDFSAKLRQLEIAENALRLHNGQSPIREADDQMALLTQTIKTCVEREGTALTPERRAHWENKFHNSPALTVLSRIADRVNEELLLNNTPAQYVQLDQLSDLAKFSAGMVVSLRMALSLPPLEVFWYVDPTESNTTPETFAHIEQLFSGIR
jgi:acetyl esterase/lipase